MVVERLAMLMELSSKEIEAVEELIPQPIRLVDFFQSVTTVDQSVLLLDFDGTLAPFRVDPSKVRPWAGVTRLLDQIQKAERTRLAIVTGRSAEEVASQMGMNTVPEIWGLHGAERLYPDGRLEQEDLIADEQAVLEAARAAIHGARLGVRVEEKRNAVVVHWRGKPLRSIHAVQTRALSLLGPFAELAGMKLLQFDGGLELRGGRDKGDAVRMILAETADNAPIAYLGDDTTDEDAFAALTGRGLGVLVRREWRPGAAQIWLRPPVQLREFLAAWLQAVRG
jgi:trehalose 6-phosphate phosphatase